MGWAGEYITWSESLKLMLWWALGWTLASPFVISLVHQFPIERPHFWRNLLIQIVASLLIISLELFWPHILDFLFRTLPNIHVPLSEAIIIEIPALLFSYGILLVAAYAIAYFWKYQEQGRLLVEARLAALRAQLNPHFLFNTLNAISELGYRDPEASDQAIGHLSELLRMILDDKTDQEIPLQRELLFLKQYVALQKTLLQDRLQVNVNVTPDVLDAKVPSMLLQPLIENAIVHGVARCPKGGSISVSAISKKGRLEIEVADDGFGLSGDSSTGNSRGFGLTSVRERLHALYGNEQTFQLCSTPSGGCTVHVNIPLRMVVGVR